MNQAHENCGYGFYISHDDNNKEYAYSTLLTTFSLDIDIGVQFDPVVSVNGSCRANRIILRR